MMKGKSGMGSHKHGTSGVSGKSPRFRHLQQLELQRAEQPKKVKPEMYGSVEEAFHPKNGKKR